MKYATLLALVSVASANTDYQELDVFNPKNFMTANFTKNMIAVTDVQGTGEVTYSQCDDDFGVFILDTDATTNSPNPVVKGGHISFNLAGSVVDAIDVTNIHVHVDWMNTPLYDEDHPQENHYDSAYSFALGWDVPSFAPSGLYGIQITGTGSNEGADGTVFCVKASMTL